MYLRLISTTCTRSHRIIDEVLFSHWCSSIPLLPDPPFFVYGMSARLSMSCILFIIVFIVIGVHAPLFVRDRPCTRRADFSWEEELSAFDANEFWRARRGNTMKSTPVITFEFSCSCFACIALNCSAGFARRVARRIAQPYRPQVPLPFCFDDDLSGGSIVYPNSNHRKKEEHM